MPTRWEKNPSKNFSKNLSKSPYKTFSKNIFQPYQPGEKKTISKIFSKNIFQPVGEQQQPDPDLDICSNGSSDADTKALTGENTLKYLEVP